jgi:hypothetical protein|tara:strand:- start:2348 stop:2788 length:441 start_codon:yes stop_codon:yes gene_type:complete
MQSERVRVCSKNLIGRGIKWSKFVPLEQEATVHDILGLFAQFLLNGTPAPNATLQTCFEVLLNNEDECMFVFMRRGLETAAGILRSYKPLCSKREQELMKIVGHTQQWNVPLWTWTEDHHELLESMERQCRRNNTRGACMGIWCYR